MNTKIRIPTPARDEGAGLGVTYGVGVDTANGSEALGEEDHADEFGPMPPLTGDEGEEGTPPAPHY